MELLAVRKKRRQARRARRFEHQTELAMRKLHPCNQRFVFDGQDVIHETCEISD